MKEENIKATGLTGQLGEIRKKWDEQNNEERIETLKREAMNIQYLVRRIVELETKLRKLEQHSHIDGKVMIPAEFRDYGSTSECSYNPFA